MLKRGKRADIAPMLWTIIGVSVAVILILVSTYGLWKLSGIFTGPGTNDQVAISNFNVLVKEIQKVQAEDQLFYYKEMRDPIQIFPGYVIASFSGTNQLRHSYSGTFRSYLTRNTPCPDESCICLFEQKNFEKEDGQPLIPCATFPKDVVIATFEEEIFNYAVTTYEPIKVYNTFNMKIGRNTNIVEPIVFYGELTEPIFNIRTLHLEKIVLEDYKKQYIIVSSYERQDDRLAMTKRLVNNIEWISGEFVVAKRDKNNHLGLIVSEQYLENTNNLLEGDYDRHLRRLADIQEIVDAVKKEKQEPIYLAYVENELTKQTPQYCTLSQTEPKPAICTPS